MRKRSFLAALAAVCVAAAGPAAAGVVDFEDFSVSACSQSDQFSGGFAFRTGFFSCSYLAGEVTPNANNGSSMLVNGYSDLVMREATGARFSVSSIDLGTSYFNYVSPNAIVLIGSLHGGGSVVQALIVSDSFQSFALTGFDDLDALLISQLQLADGIGPNFGGDTGLNPDSNGVGYFAVDNIVYDLVRGEAPEPAGLPLAALALAAVGWARAAGRWHVAGTPTGRR